VSSTTETLPARVPFLDLAGMHRGLADAVLADVAELIESSAFINGPQVAQFEDAFGRYCGSQHCIGLASGLDALRLALVALDLEPGGEVLVPAMTFVATFEAVTQAGGVPVPADISEHDYGLDADAAAAAVTPRTFGIVPVHLFGQMADMTRLGELARSCELVLLEDACQAHGAVRDGLRAGVVGHAGAFSFYPGKNLGAMGDAGALVTDDAEVADRVRALREHGQRRKYEHDLIGWTARIDTIQAIVVLHKLKELDRWNDDRRRVAGYYEEALGGVGDLRLPATAQDAEHVWHLYVVRTADPGGLAGFLAERGIGAGRHYPQPPHLTAAYEQLGFRVGAFPVAEALAAECLSLPIFPGMSESQLERVVQSVREWFAGG
jgi:dTDP-4-amino-4,6-dideoxygalactose transaminase